jgi:hypothetical protein
MLNLRSFNRFILISLVLLGCSSKSLNLSNVGTMLSASNWSQVSAVSVPVTIWLFGTALLGLVGFGKRRNTV